MRRIVILIILMGIPSPLFAQSWVKTGGPIGGLGYDVRIHPGNKNVMLVTDNWSGVNKSTNAGASWSTANAGITVRAGATNDAVPIFSLTIDPNNTDRLWAGTQGEGEDFGVFRSDDGGASWTLKVNGITLGTDAGLVFRGFTVQPGNSSVVYAQAEVPTTVDGREFNRTKGRIYKTTDAGENWNLIWQGDNLCRYLIVHPTNSNILYASTGIFDREAFNSDCGAGVAGGVGVLKSTDGGTNWTQINTGLTSLYVGSLRMHPSNPEILFAATGNNACSTSGSEGLFRTTNGGTSWTKVISAYTMTTVNFSPSNSDMVYAGSELAFFRSSDGGETWETFGREEGVWGPPGVRAGFPIDVTVDPDDPNLLYANNYGGGVFKSTDGAETWLSWSAGYTGAEVHDLDVYSGASGLVYAVGRSGPFRSTDGGGTWTGIATGDAAGIPEWYAIKQKPDDPNVILITDEHRGVILRSTNQGGDFTEILQHPSANENESTQRQGFKALAFAPPNTEVVYAGIAEQRNLLESTPPSGTAVYKSTNAGESWSAQPSDIDGISVNDFAVDPNDEETVYAATTGGVYKTTNGAGGWSFLSGLGDRDIRSVTLDPSNPLVIYAGEESGGVWKSTDAGSNWEGPKNTGFSSANPSVREIVVDPTNGSVVYAGDWTSGVYRSTNGGETWSGFPDSGMSGLSMRAVRDLAISADGAVLYAATHGEGVFRYGTPQEFVDEETGGGSEGGGGGGGGCTLIPRVPSD